MKEKFKKYFERMPSIITCAAALNPYFNIHGVEFLIELISTDLDFFDDSYATKAKKWFTDSFEGLYNIYYTKYGNPTTTESSSGGGDSSFKASHRNQVTTLLRRLKEHKNKKARSDPSLSSEYERYVHSDFVTHLQTTEFEIFDVLGFWKAKQTTFPVLSRMAMDILSVQSTSVASEFAFQQRKQNKSTLETPVDFEEEILDSEVQTNEAISLSNEEIALDATSSEGEPSSLFDFEEVMNNNQNQESPPQNGPPPMMRPNGQAPRTMKELCQPSINGRGGPIAPIPIQATDFGLRHHMIQQVQNTCQFHGLPGDDANRHINKFLKITQHMKQNGVSDDALRLSLFPYSLTHHVIAWYDRLPRNSIHYFDVMMRKFLSKYFPPSMVTKLRNEITKFEQKPHESLFEAWERYKLSIDRYYETIQTIKAVDTKCETCGGPHSITECPAVGGYTQETAYATTGNYNSEGFQLKVFRSSNATALDSPYLLVLITGTSQSRQHVDTSLIHLESCKSPTAELFDVDPGRIFIHHCEY
nr:reverse transcriptase domain-containing protein [Tanacetum cinerariifolium]